MSTQVQYRRGSNVQVAAFTGALGEIVVDTTNKVLVVNDGVQAGGFPQVGLTAAQTITNKIYNGTSLSVTGNVTAGGAIINGDLSVTGNATLSGNILGDRIVNGTTSFEIQTSNGNANISVAGTTNVAVFSSTALTLTGNLLPSANITYNLGSNTQRWNDLWLSNSTIYIGNAQLSANATALIFTNPQGGQTVLTGTSAGITGATVSVTGNVTGGNVLTGGLISATGNITGNYILGNGSQLTGIDATSIQSGTSNVKVVSSGGNVTTSVGGTSNVVVVATTGQFVTGVNSVSGNVTGGNILTAGLISATGNVTGGNIRTAGLISATGSITTAGDISITGNIVDGAALTIITSSNGNITMAPNGTGVVVVNTDIRNGQATGTGNIGATGATFNTIFAKATSAQYADLAEMYVADADYEPGTVIDFGGANEVTQTTTSHSTCVAGIVSTNPSYLMNSALSGKHVIPVALTGRVPCKVTGTIRKGDRLVSSHINGVATVIDAARYEPGCIVGKSLENYNSDQIGIIEVAVGRT